MVELGAGVEDRDDVRRTGGSRPRVADAHAVEGVLVAGLWVVYDDAELPALIGQFDAVVRLDDGDRGIGAQVGDGLIHGAAAGRYDDRDADVGGAIGGIHDAHPALLETTDAARAAELDHDLPGDDPVGVGRGYGCGRWLGGCHRQGRSEEEHDGENGAVGSRHDAWAPVRFAEVRIATGRGSDVRDHPTPPRDGRAT